MEVVQAIETGDLSQIMAMMTKLWDIANNLRACSFEQTFSDVYNFCTKSSDTCSTSTIIANVQKNMFVLIGKFSEITEVLKNFPADTAEALQTQTNTVGSDIGSIFRSLLAYESF